MKKLIALLLALAIVFTLSACGGEKEPEFENALEEGKYYYEKGDHLLALETLKTIYAVDPLYKEAAPLIEEITDVYVKDVLDDVAELSAQGSHVDAINLMRRARVVVTDKELLAAYDSEMELFFADVRVKADAAFETGGFPNAEMVINEAFSELSDDAAKEKLLSEYEERAKKYLGKDILPSEASSGITIKPCPVNNNKGKEYTEGYYIVYDGVGTGTVKFELNREFSRLYGTFTIADGSTGAGNAIINITNKGQTVQSHNKLSPTFSDKDFDAPISSVETLTITFRNAGTTDAPVKGMLVSLYVM